MPTIGNMPAADLKVAFASGQTRTVNMIRLLVQTQNAEMQAAHGMFLPGVGKLHPTVRALREAYELDYFYDAPVRTWKDAALAMRHFHDMCLAHVRDTTSGS
jgi:imidazoleglycerol phosphate synthase glutamine amidotransferase subunit HisH